MQKVELKILDKRIGKEFPLPRYATDGAAGMDICACIDEHIHIALNQRPAACNSSETSAGTRLVNSYDVNSVMHYPQCRPTNAGGYRQTELDYSGSIGLYGLAPALTMVTSTMAL